MPEPSTPNPHIQALSAQIGAAIKAKKIPMSEIIGKTGLSHTTIYDFLNPSLHHNMTTENLAKIADVVGMKLVLVPKESKEKKPQPCTT